MGASGGAEYFGLEGKVAVVTGASSGLGAHFAKVLAGAGAHVIAIARRADRLKSLISDIETSGGRAMRFVADVTDRAALEHAFAAGEDTFGCPEILINNAGIAIAGGFLKESDADLAKTMAVNQTAVWSAAQIFARNLMQADKPGSIVNIASITGLRGTAGTASYAMTKAAVAHLTKIQALELARHGIRANAIAPGYFSSEMTEGFLASAQGQSLKARIPMRRSGELEELDGLLLLLASERSSFMTGAVIPIDGGHLVANL